MSKDKRKIILKALYDSHSNNGVSYYDLKPLMKDWTKDEIVHILNDLTFIHKPSLINCQHIGEFSYTRIGTMMKGTELVNRDNYIADAFITPDGEKYYREVYLHRHWKAWQIRFDVVSKPVLVLVAVLSIAWSIYNSQANENSQILSKITIDSLKTEMKKVQLENLALTKKLQLQVP